uniref:E4 protein n=1 Tax=Human papillomavirus TaxID=10566 RepID=A0A385PI11_9PAPI|nr:MAG: E4 protein [Human papillomavirus]
MQMDFTLMNLMVTEFISNILGQILTNMEVQENGLFTIEMQLLSPLPVPTGGSGTNQKTPPSSQVPPGTPRPQRRNADESQKRSTLLHHPQQLPARRPLVFEIGDEEDNKENVAPYQKEDEWSPLSELLRQLLLKWEADIDCLRDRVLEDFSDFKSKLGIRPY